MPYLLVLDQGTTSSKAMLYSTNGHLLAKAGREYRQIYPQPGWVEHDPYEILSSTMGAIRDVLASSGTDASDILGVGITNQRETTIVWDRKTGEPIYNAIVWQCRRTAGLCEQLIRDGHENLIRNKTGLRPDAYFSATKIRWILDHTEGAQERAERGELCFGTVDSWLIYQLTEKKEHRTDYTNASRTMLYNIHTREWDTDLLRLLRIPKAMLPEVLPSRSRYGVWHYPFDGGCDIPICGVAGDQQAALFGQHCFLPGEAKNTYGTGCFLLMNTGTEPSLSENGLLTTLTAGTTPDASEYAMEGSVFTAGAVVQWLRDELGLIQSASESETVAASVPDTGGVYLVPAFTGLGAPYWDMRARGTIVGLTRGSNRAHLVRAALESIAYQSADVLRAAEADTKIHLSSLHVDGGASQNALLMQTQADLLGIPVIRPDESESTSLGAAYLAGLELGVWSGVNELRALSEGETCFRPSLTEEERHERIKGWKRAVASALSAD